MIKEKSKKNVLITGGQLENKGAQAMTFVVVSEIKRKYPNIDIVLVSNIDVVRTEKDLHQYNFTVIAYPSVKSLYKWQWGLSDDKRKVFDAYLNNSICIIDISGYRLGSTWGIKKSLSYCAMIEYANKHNVPTYILPQSFGPFDYKWFLRPILKCEIKRALKKAKIIMARENSGKELLENMFRLRNVIKTSDLVIQSPEAEQGLVYRDAPKIIDIPIEKNSVAVIPNEKNILHGSLEKCRKLYTDIIDYLILNKKKVYIIYHSINDIVFCKQLKEMYKDSEQVVFIDKELSCFDFSANVSKFDYVIASRFHSIVHSYKKKVPALVVGWSTKYFELMSDFKQEKYCFDIDCTSSSEILNRLKEIDYNYKLESEIIGSELSRIQQDNVFDYLSIE